MYTECLTTLHYMLYYLLFTGHLCLEHIELIVAYEYLHPYTAQVSMCPNSLVMLVSTMCSIQYVHIHFVIM